MSQMSSRIGAAWKANAGKKHWSPPRLVAASCVGFALTGLVASLPFGGCTIGGLTNSAAESGPPHVVGLSVGSASLGNPIDVYGSGMASGQVRVRIRGTYVTDKTKRKIPVDVTLDSLKRLDPATFRWDTFGPYCPEGGLLGDCTETGVLTATYTAKVTAPNSNREVSDPEPPRLTLRVEPSLVYTDFQPEETTCAGPATRAFGELSYRASVQAMGFVPVSVEYALTTPQVGRDGNGMPVLAGSGDAVPTQVQSFKHAGVQGGADAVAGLVLPPVPVDRSFYGFSLVATARDGSGKAYTSTLATTARLPVETYDTSDTCDLVEVSEPQPVSGCQGGSDIGFVASYMDQETETRTRAIAVTYDSGFVKSTSASQGQSQEKTFQTTDGKTQSTSFADTQSKEENSQIWQATGKDTSNTFSVGYSHGTVVTLNNEHSNASSRTEAEQPNYLCVNNSSGAGAKNAADRGGSTSVNGGASIGPVTGGTALTQEGKNTIEVNGARGEGTQYCTYDKQQMQAVLGALLAQQQQQTPAATGGGGTAQPKDDPSDPRPTPPDVTDGPAAQAQYQKDEAAWQQRHNGGGGTPTASGDGVVRNTPVLEAAMANKNFDPVAKNKLVTTVDADASAGSDSDATNTTNSDGDARTIGETETRTGIEAATNGRSNTSTDGTSTLKQTANGTSQGTSTGTTQGESATNGQGQSFSWTASSSVLTGQISTVPVLPGNVARWWRNVERCQRKTYVLLYNKCGQSSVIGTATMDDWRWGVELAQGPGQCSQPDEPQVYPSYKKLSSYSCSLADQSQCCLKSGKQCGTLPQ